MAIPYNINPVTRGVNGFGLPVSDHRYSATLADATDTTLAVPLDLPMGAMGMIGTSNPTGNIAQAPQGRSKWIAMFSYDVKTLGNVWVAVGATAAVPAGAGLLLSTSQLNPTALDVYSGDVLHFITDTASINLSVVFYHIQE